MWVVLMRRMFLGLAMLGHMADLKSILRQFFEPNADARRYRGGRTPMPNSVPLLQEYLNTSLPEGIGGYTYRPESRFADTVEIDYNQKLLQDYPKLALSIINHERLHGYQNYLHRSRLGMGVVPLSGEVMRNKVLKDTPLNYDGPGVLAYELPAYAFMNDDVGAQSKDFARYVTDGYVRSGGRTGAIETLLPPKLHKNYITTTPRPLLGPDVPAHMDETMRRIGFLQQLGLR